MAVVATTVLGCKKSPAADSLDGGTDGSSEPVPVACPPVDGATDGDPDSGTLHAVDEFGPNAPMSKTASSLGRVNIFEVTTPTTLERADIYLRSDLPQARLTIAVQESPSRTAPFVKVTSVQIDFGTCEGWASTGTLSVPLRAGHFYAIGFDPNQVLTPSVSTDGDSLPIDGRFGRLLGSRTVTSVSVPTLSWDKFLDSEYNRQRIVTSPRVPDALDSTSADAGADAGSSDASTATDATAIKG
jgi:hypothetical protein